MKKTDLTWAAGVIDGEGCIGIYRASFTLQLVLRVANIDPKMILKLEDLFGGHIRVSSPDKRPRRRRAFHWIIRDRRAENVLRKLLPFLVTKHDEAVIALNFGALRKGNGNHYTQAAHKKRTILQRAIADRKKIQFPHNALKLVS